MTSERISNSDRNSLTIPERPSGTRTEPKFVRGEGQLAVYREHWHQTGHMLTLWEATQAYGESTINEALEYGSAILRETQTATKDALTRRRSDLN